MKRIPRHIILLSILTLLVGCTKIDPDYDLLTSTEVKVVLNGNGQSVACPFCQGTIKWGRYHHHTCSQLEHCPVDSCEYQGQNHRHCFYNGEGACPGHERGHGGMGGGSWL